MDIRRSWQVKKVIEPRPSNKPLTLEGANVAATAKKESDSMRGLQVRDAHAFHVDQLREQVYEAQQSARTDIDQGKIQALKAQDHGIKQKLSQAKLFTDRAPLLAQQNLIRDEINSRRFPELRDARQWMQSREPLQLRLLASHSELNDAARRHPELASLRSPVTRDALSSMSRNELGDFMARLDKAATHARNAARSLDTAKAPGTPANKKQECVTAAQQSVASADKELSQARQTIERGAGRDHEISR